ncbi:hypothetical protein RND81_10G173200 [Saponaria officinalis]|uniref:Endonuclease/exonuclease/phosphatase domain-containing protein n=1 Tax=Saponaria officinalis TaxID=3572 RepID=A0AAW1I3D9_SAPOF
MEKWLPSISQELECLSVIPVWVLLPGLDPLYWSSSILSKIASKIGSPLFADRVISTKERLGFARLMVEVDVSKPLVRHVILNTSFTDGVFQPVEYEWVPYFCHTCKKLGHESSRCKLNKIKAVHQVYRPKPGATVEQGSSEQQPPVSSEPPIPVSEHLVPVSEPHVQSGSPVSIIGKGSSSTPPPSQEAWNVRGLNVPLRQHEIKEFLAKNKAVVAGLLETRVKLANSNKIMNKFLRYRCVGNYSAHYNGRIWVLWQESLVALDVLQVHDQLVHCKVLLRQSNLSIFVTFVHGYNDGLDRRCLWHELLSISSTIDLGWLVIGDFNVVRNVEDKIGKYPPTSWEMLDFNACVGQCNLDELLSHGGPFTWTNNQDGVDTGRSRLDWAFMNPLWVLLFPNDMVFKFLNCWIEHPNFYDVFSSAWSGHVPGTPMYRLFAKLKRVKHALGGLHGAYYANLSARVALAHKNLLTCQVDLLNTPLDHTALHNVSVAKQAYIKLKEAELSMLAQRAKIHHNMLSDSNTSYFYAAVTTRKQHSFIGSIVDRHGQLHSSSDGVAYAITNYYQFLLGSSASVSILEPSVSYGVGVSHVQALSLTATITSVEIKNALFGMGSHKSPGLVGFSSEFFKASWEIIAKDFTDAVRSYFRSGKC